ncbi:hypothetical protein FRC20_004368 [Serendipita sp. 405]|nr:hypothetical protein FRC15_003662 [Serendipita sp. 397]KAG8800017.1 hypothetical protein FRC16_003883 [Serendipita sp. 398]KAG8867997.1 hypothetical protein FRC20_004368 [Serendipita sp. 405]
MLASSQRSPQQGLLIDQYSKARQTLEASSTTLCRRLGSRMPDRLTQSLYSCIRELEELEMSTRSLLNGYSFSDAALAQSRLLSDALRQTTELFKEIQDVDERNNTLPSLTIAPSSVSGEFELVGGDLDLEAGMGDPVDFIPNSLHAVKVEHDGLHRLIQSEKYPQLQQTKDRHYWARHALTEAFKENPFKLTHKGVQNALDKYHKAGVKAIASDAQARQKFFDQQHIVDPLVPMTGLRIAEEEIWERTELAPVLDLAALNHHYLNPVNDVNDSVYTHNATELDENRDKAGVQRADSAENTTQLQGVIIDAQTANSTRDITDTVKIPRMPHCFSSMERMGAEWIESQPRNALPRTVGELCSVEDSFLEVKTFLNTTKTKSAIESECISQQSLNDAKAIAGKAKRSALRQYRRIAVVGGTSHGKTSFLNELIGEEILHTDGRASTSWPFIIRHDPLAVVPELHISNSHFQPFLQDIADVKPSVYMDKIRQKSRKTTVDNKKLRLWDSLKEKNPTFDQDIADWESRKYTFPGTTSRVGPINQMNIRIGQLIRIWYLCGLRKNQNFSDEDWPILTVAMKNIGEETRSMRIEFVDLPGYGEVTVLKEDVVACWEAVIRNSHGVIIVYRAERIQLDKDETLTLMTSIQTFAQPNKPVIAIGTHCDHHQTERDWGMEDDMELFEWLWPEDTEKLVKKRTVTISNIWHLSAPIVIERIKTNVPFEYDALAEGSGYAAMRAWGDKEATADSWSTLTPERLVNWMEKLIKRSNFPDAVEKVYLLALSATKRQLKPQLSNALLSFSKVQHSNSTLLYMARKKTQEMEDLARQYEEFAAKVIEFCSKWWQDRGRFAAQRRTNAEKLAWDAKLDAQKKFTSLIMDLIKGQKIRVIGKTLEFLDREKASEFIQKLEFGLRAILHKVQLTSVVEVRQQLETAWDDRGLELKSCFMTVDTKSDKKSLRETISNSINKHLSLSTSSIEDILSRLLCNEATLADPGLKIPDVPYLRARSQAEKIYQTGKKEDPHRRVAIVQYITGFKMDNLTRLGSISGSIIREESSGEIPDDESRPPSNDIGADVVNIVGVLGRPTVLATPPDLDLYPWKFLNGKERNVEGPIQITQDEIKETYSKGTIDKWHQTLKNEWLDSIDGVIDLCSALGLSIVIGDLSTHRAHLRKKLEAEEAKNMPGDELPCLVVAQANCCALVGAFEEVLKECARDDLDP